MQHRSDKEFQVIFFLLKFPYRIVLDLHLFFFGSSHFVRMTSLSLSLPLASAESGGTQFFFARRLTLFFSLKRSFYFSLQKERKKEKRAGFTRRIGDEAAVSIRFARGRRCGREKN